jgi:dipeptidyl aminopeptidase/acylaminoacyl peptidase
MKRLILSLALLPLCLWTAAEAQEVMTPETLWSLRRVSGPAVSPDGTRFVYGVRVYDIAENRGNTDLFLLSVNGGDPVRLTDTPGSESNYAWRPDGQRIGFLSAESGSVQLWEIDPTGLNMRQVSDIEGGIGNFAYSPTGTHVSFTRNVKLDRTVQEVYPDLPKADARIMDGLMYRHWDAWRDYAYSHLFVADYDNGRIGTPVDVMPGERYDTPLNPFGGVEQIAWSPDGRRIAYTSKKLVGTEYATSTNSDIYVYDLASRSTSNITEGMMGYDIEPTYSPDGRYMAWLSMRRDGYEADRNRLFIRDVRSGIFSELTVGFDQDAHGPVWSPTSRTIYFTSEKQGTIQLFAADITDAIISQVTEGQHDYGAFAVAARRGGTSLIASRTSMAAPADIFQVDATTGVATQLTFANADILGNIELGEVEPRWVTTTDDKEMLAWVIYPPGFDPTQQYPALLYCQGGPQGTVSQFFSYRWNFQMMAANGYVVIAPNRRGVPSFGQEWKEEISGDWGGQAMQDLLSAIDDIAQEPYVDANRLGAVGASFGGYSVFWLAGNHAGRFKVFIAHDGAFNLESMYGATEEMFFPNFDLKGAYWDNPYSYEHFSPHNFVGNWDTPILVIHGQKDFRLPVTESMQAFTAAQLQGIPSRFLYFPEENHWVLSAQDGIVWQRVFFDWLDRYLKQQEQAGGS